MENLFNKAQFKQYLLVNILVAKNYLKKIEGIENDFAANGLEALNLIKDNLHREFYYDIILMDCNMPIMDGYTASKEILSMVNEGIIPPLTIIATTASSSQFDHENCFSHGMTDIISKPFGKQQLREKMEIYFKNN